MVRSTDHHISVVAILLLLWEGLLVAANPYLVAEISVGSVATVVAIIAFAFGVYRLRERLLPQEERHRHQGCVQGDPSLSDRSGDQGPTTIGLGEERRATGPPASLCRLLPSTCRVCIHGWTFLFLSPNAFLLSPAKG